MNRTRVKICGITNVGDAMAAVAAGADALGFVFFEKSQRNVSLKQAAQLMSEIPAFVTTVALFVNASQSFVEKVVHETGVDLLQFHGDEDEMFCSQFSRPYIKAIRMKANTDLRKLANEFHSSQALLLDTYVKGVPGGTGESFNWEWVLQQGVSKPIILAGGLKPGNVNSAVQLTNVYAVDVSGGVEASPGIKNHNKIQEFIDRV